jgi:cysteine-rich repeat protein
MRRVVFAVAIMAVAWALNPGGLAADPSTFHFMSIVEVFPGAAVQPNAQYVVLQMYFAGQNFVAGHKLFIFNAAGVKIDSATFPANVANGANQAKILIGTSQVSSFFNVTPDLIMNSSIPLAGGKICFDATNVDCVAWGNYSGSSVGVGTPFNAAEGLELGKAAKRRLDIAGGATTLDAADDTNDSENDFNFDTPAPRNNANQNGTIPPSTCGNGTLEGLEQCDDGNTTPGDGCDAICETEPPVCGNGVLEDGEECDDGNTTAGDGCNSVCDNEFCGDGVTQPALGEECDDGNLIAGDGCNPVCSLEVCGNGVLDAGEGCDDGNTISGDGCSSTCQIEGACNVTITGDVNNSGTITSADIIYLVNYVFKGQAPPMPCAASGDVNCSGTVTSADIIFLVGFVFKGGPAPCDVCTLIPGTWTCP